jgi:hypothetical protein
VSWTTRVEFPSSSRENSFVARLWATQRIGYLSAEKRKSGGSREIDDEIKSLGEKYAIPTEFTSYLVVEPGMRRAQGSVLSDVVVTGVATAAQAPSTAAFEAARTAAKQRAAVNLAMGDEADLSKAATTRRVGTRVFALHGETWTDLRKVDSTNVVKIKAYSAAWFRLVDAIPELREVFALGDKLVVAGRAISIVVGADGVESLDDNDLKRIQSQW